MEERALRFANHGRHLPRSGLMCSDGTPRFESILWVPKTPSTLIMLPFHRQASIVHEDMSNELSLFQEGALCRHSA